MNRRPGQGRRQCVLHDLFTRKRQKCQNLYGPLDDWQVAFGRGRGSSRRKRPKSVRIRGNPRQFWTRSASFHRAQSFVGHSGIVPVDLGLHHEAGAPPSLREGAP